GVPRNFASSERTNQHSDRPSKPNLVKKLADVYMTFVSWFLCLVYALQKY
ncbi:hypothetical protein CISIN_1g0087142mg, partial [Citrus sinensis]